ncbi:eIF-2-alpha kinase [Trichophyton mentagrophytes]|nr:eIF-2-alpha kinase [Trichophyton mentagrophytes]
MPRKQRKGSTKTNGSPVEEKQQTASNPALATNYEEIHKNEADALRSIYGDEFEDVETKPSAWNQSSTTSFKLQLKASSNPEVRVCLLVELPTTYPKSVPILKLETVQDVRQSAKERLESVLKSKPVELLGSEMIYELAVAIEDILEDCAQAQAQDKDLPSLEEERIVQEAAALQQAERLKQEELARQQEATVEEEKSLQLLVEDKLKQRQRENEQLSRRKSRTNAEDFGLLESVVDVPDAISFDPPMAITGLHDRPLWFKSVSGKNIIGKSHYKETFLVRPIVQGNTPLAPLLVLKEIFIQESEHKDIDLRFQISVSEDKLEFLKKLRHPNLVDFIGFKIQRPIDSSSGQSGTWHIYALFEHANKGSLSELLDIVGSVPADNARAWMIQLVEALEYYNRHGVVHGNIHCGRVLLFRSPSSTTTVKLLGNVEEVLPLSSTARRRSLTTPKSPFWLPPELAGEGMKPTIKTDVWDLGILFLQMGFGKDILQRYTSADAVINAMELSPQLEDMLVEIFRSDPKKRPTPFQIQPFEFFRVDTPLIVPTGTPGSSSLPHRTRHDSQGHLAAISRYSHDFDEVGRLGRGGYGLVVKARNKLDGRFYAVKKISQKSPVALKDTLSEIMLLSRLNHPYVVRYFTAWLEENYVAMSDDDDSDAILSSDGSGSHSGDNIEFGYSTSGLDFISSSGYPKVEFGYDTDEEGESDTISDGTGAQKKGNDASTTEEGVSLRRVRSGSQSRVVPTTLYIQMEYCEKHTLRDLIRFGLHENIDSSWRLFRQILDGLNHIHSHGILHRDLKPDNIFIDMANNPRIGDFGLATSGQLSSTDRSPALESIAAGFTQSVGTTYYVAPEVKKTSMGQYNEKVDMYSLGIIFFEMCYPLETGMERDRILQGIRQKEHTLPDAFNLPEKVAQGEIILSLISHRPSERPTTAELLQSDKIPLQVEEEMFRKAVMGLLSDPDSPDYKKVLSAIFSQPQKKFEDIAWDIDSRASPTATELLLHGVVKDKLTALFRKHGAVETCRQSLFPRSSHYGPGAVRLLDPGGNLVQLPYDLTLPNARALPKQDLSIEKAFSFGTVYRESVHRGEPRGHKEVDFDIVSYNTLDLPLKEAEVIKVLDEIIDEFPPLRSTQMCFHLNHSDLLEAVVAFCRITPEQRPIVKEVISKLNIGQYTMQKIRSELRSPSIGVSSTSIDDLSRFDFRDTPQKALSRLHAIMDGTEYADRLSPIFNRLNIVVSYLEKFKVKRKVYISPLSSLNDKFYNGSVLFQCVFDKKRRDVFAAGGRYDSLIQEFQPILRSNRPRSHAVGFNLGLDKLNGSMTNYLKGSNKSFLKPDAEVGNSWRKIKCDVLVASFDPSVLRTVGVGIVSTLWAHDISAELAADTTPSLEDLLTRYVDDNYSWVVIVKQDSIERGLRVKSIQRKEDFDVRSSDLIPWLRNEMRARRKFKHDRPPDSPKLVKHPSQVEASLSSKERDSDVRILTPLHKSKKTNRRNIVEFALRRSREVLDKGLDGPIAAIDVRDDVLESIRDTRLSDPDSWRNAIQSAPLVERKYLGNIHELLIDLASESVAPDGTVKYTNAFVYNYRTGNCIYYDLKRGN